MKRPTASTSRSWHEERPPSAVTWPRMRGTLWIYPTGITRYVCHYLSTPLAQWFDLKERECSPRKLKIYSRAGSGTIVHLKFWYSQISAICCCLDEIFYDVGSGELSLQINVNLDNLFATAMTADHCSVIRRSPCGNQAVLMKHRSRSKSHYLSRYGLADCAANDYSFKSKASIWAITLKLYGRSVIWKICFVLTSARISLRYSHT